MYARNSLALLIAMLAASASPLLTCACNSCPLAGPGTCDREERDCCDPPDDPPEAPATCPCIHSDGPDGLPVEGEASIPSCTTSGMGEVHLPAPFRAPLIEVRPEGPDPPGSPLYLIRVLRF